MVAIERVTPREEIAALRRLLEEAALELDWLVKAHPQFSTSSIAGVLERCEVALLRR